MAESEGLRIGKDLVVISGFTKTFIGNLSRQVYAYDTTQNPLWSSKWRTMDDIPSIIPSTHAGFVLVNDTDLYLCGGYIGGHPGRGALLLNVASQTLYMQPKKTKV